MIPEEFYGKLWRTAAKAEGHRAKIPSIISEQVRSDAPELIIKTLSRGSATMTQLMAEVGIGKPNLTNYLYKMRARGKVHSVQEGRFVRWHLGPEQVAA